MAAVFSFGTAARVWLDGKQAACSLNDLTMNAELDEAETTTLCSTIKDYIPGLAEVTIEFEGLFDINTASPATTLDAWLDARFGTTFPMTFAPEGGGQIGDPAYFMNGFLQEYEIEATVDEAVSIKGTLRCSSALARGRVILSDNSPKTTTGNNGNGPSASVVDNGVATTNGGVAVLHVSALSGTTPSGTFRIQHSVDGTTAWTDLATFAAETAINGQYVTVAPGTTVNRYLRAAWVISGTTPSVSAEITFKRN